MNKLLFGLLAGIATASMTVTSTAQSPAAGGNSAPVGTQATDRTVPGTGTIDDGPPTSTRGTGSATGTGAQTPQPDRTVPGTGTLGSDPATATNGTTSAAGAGTGNDRTLPGERGGTLGSDPATATDGTSSAAGAGTSGRDLRSSPANAPAPAGAGTSRGGTSALRSAPMRNTR